MNGQAFSLKILLLDNRIHGTINHGKSAPDHDTKTTMFDILYDVGFITPKCSTLSY